MKLSPTLSPTRSKGRAASRRGGFSLVETLMVVGIFSILMMLTLSSVPALKSQSLTSAGNAMVDAFSLARQNSVSKNVYTAVVVKKVGNGAGSAYCLLQLGRQDDGNLGTWTAVTPWRFLRPGIAFETGQTADTFISAPATLPLPLPTSFSFQGQNIDLTATTAVQCYQPDGSLLAGATAPVRLALRLIEGKDDPATGASTYQGATVGGQAASYYDLILVLNTGVVKIERP